MESASQMFAEAAEEGEECHSTKSGWTTYLASPSNDDYSSDEELSNGDSSLGENSEEDCDDRDDDSMASDASSGYTHREHNAGRRNGESSCSSYKAKKPSVKKENEGKKAVFVYSSKESKKVTKNKWIANKGK